LKQLGTGVQRGHFVDGPSARALLSSAREALSRGQTTTASHLLERAEELHPHRADRAEAGTLRAEIALLEHKPTQAVDHYLSVATRYADLTAGENALFAAAQLASRNGRDGQAREFARHRPHAL
jgi:hypothetical protein